MADKQVASVFHKVIEFVHEIPLCLVIEVYHDISAEYHMELSFEREVLLHQVEFSINNFASDSIDQNGIIIVNFPKIA